jgi:hypothetical protein
MTLSLITVSIIVILKYITPLFIIPFPFAAGWFNFILDTVDGDMLIPLGLTDPTYQMIDKSADWFTYFGMIFATRLHKWKIAKWIYLLFALRSVGQIAFFITSDERVFFIFPNFLEPLFLIYATIIFIKKNKAYAFYLKNKVLIWSFVVLYKMQDEYITHIGNFDRSELISTIIRKYFSL